MGREILFSAARLARDAAKFEQADTRPLTRLAPDDIDGEKFRAYGRSKLAEAKLASERASAALAAFDERAFAELAALDNRTEPQGLNAFANADVLYARVRAANPITSEVNESDTRSPALVLVPLFAAFAMPSREAKAVGPTGARGPTRAALRLLLKPSGWILLVPLMTSSVWLLWKGNSDT